MAQRILKINSFSDGPTRAGYVHGSNISSSSSPNGSSGGNVTIYGNSFDGTNNVSGDINDCRNIYATGGIEGKNSVIRYTNYYDGGDYDPDDPTPEDQQAVMLPFKAETTYGWFTYLGTQSLTTDQMSASGVSAGTIGAGNVTAGSITSTTSSLGNATATNLTSNNVTTRTMTANSATIGSLNVNDITINGMSLCQYISTVCGYNPTGEGPTTPTGNPYTFSIQGNQTDGYYTLADYNSNMVATNGTARISLEDAREAGAVYTETNSGETDVRMTVNYTITGNVQITGISDVNLGGTMMSGVQLMNTTLSNGAGAFLTVTNYAIEYIAPPQYTQIDFYFDLDDGRRIDMNCSLNYQGAMGFTSAPQSESE